MPIPTNANVSNKDQRPPAQSQPILNERKRRRPKRFKLRLSPAKKQRIDTDAIGLSGDGNAVSHNKQIHIANPTQPKQVGVQQPKARSFYHKLKRLNWIDIVFGKIDCGCDCILYMQQQQQQ